MTTFIIRRILYLFPVLIGILIATFIIKSLIPTDVVTQMYMGVVSEANAKEAIANIRHQFHLDQPMIVQFGYYIKDLLHGNFGISVRTRQPVADELLYRFANTMKLTLASLVIGIVVGVSAGIVSAYFKDTWIDFIAMVTSMFGLSMPAFFFGLILIIIFCVDLKWLPIVVLGQGNWKQLILPSLNLGLILAASLSRITRSSMLEVLNQDYIRTARAKGLPERLVIFKHALRNALMPVVTIIGLQVGSLLGGAFIIENVFAWHGIGELGVNAIRWKDFTITQGIILISATTYVVVNLAVDILYKFINPRIRVTDQPMSISSITPPVNNLDFPSNKEGMPERKIASIILRKLIRKRSAQVGIAIIFLLVFCALFGSWITPHDPFRINSDIRLSSPSSQYLFGTDEQGRDLLSRIIYGSRYTIMVMLVTTSIALIAGLAVALPSAYLGGWFNSLMMRIMDVMLGFPYIMLILAIVAVIGPSLVNAMVAIGIAYIPDYARLARSSILAVKEEEYVVAERALGASTLRIILHTILPNIISPLIVFVSLTMPTAVLSSAALSFLGLGAQPPSPEWGAMMVNSRDFLTSAPWVVLSPGLAIFASILGINLFGNALRDVLDPRSITEKKG